MPEYDLANPAVFEYPARVRYSETGHDGRMTLPALINLFQDCSISQSESIGYGPALLKHEQRAWVLSHWHLVVTRYPHFAEDIVAGTFANGFKTVSATRSFFLSDAEGTLIARANTTWGFIDLESGRPVRPAADHVAAYGQHDALAMPPEDGRRIALPQDMQPAEPIVVKRSHIDTNEHVNNCQYVRFALDVLDEDVQAHELRVDFRRSAVLGDVIYPKVAHEPGSTGPKGERKQSRTVVALCDAEGGAYGVVELR